MSKDTITHVVLDVDGTLLNTEELASECNNYVTQLYGKTFTYEIKKYMIGKSPRDAAATCVSMLGLPITPEEFLKIRAPKLEEGFKHVKPMPGAKEFIRELKRRKIPVALATGSLKKNHIKKLNANNNSEWLGDIPTVTSDEISRGKPDPEIFIKACELIGKTSGFETVLVVEDAPSGVEGALRGGMRVVAVPDKRNDHPIFDQATQKLDSLEKFDFETFTWKGNADSAN